MHRASGRPHGAVAQKEIEVERGSEIRSAAEGCACGIARDGVAAREHREGAQRVQAASDVADARAATLGAAHHARVQLARSTLDAIAALLHLAHERLAERDEHRGGLGARLESTGTAASAAADGVAAR